MPDAMTVSLPGGSPPENLRGVLDRFLAAWERAADGQPVPVIDDFLKDLPDPDRPAARAALEAIEVWARGMYPAAGHAAETLSQAGSPPASLAPETVSHAGSPTDTASGTPGTHETADFDPHAPARDDGDFSLGEPTPGGGTIAHTPRLGPTIDSPRTPMSVTSEHTPGAAPSFRATAPRTGRPVRIPGYEILGELGRGGMGVVYKARQLKLNRMVAVKLMLSADHTGTTARERFDAEAEAVARMQHPNIVQIYERGEVDGMPFFSLEYVAGGTLSRKIAKNLLKPNDTAALMVTLARAMHYAHQHDIIHRDLKPGNILIGDDGVPKIADFGLAKKLEEDSGLTRMGTVVGTPSYMPPEQARGDLDQIGPLADVYALGAILYELLTGRPPFKGVNILETLEQVRTQEPLAPSSLQPGTPADLETICLKCLQKDPAKRYATAGELADDLARYLDGRPILARPVGNFEKVWRWAKRNPEMAKLLGTIAGLLVLLTVVASGAAVVFANQRNEIAKQKKVVEDQRDEIAAKEKLAVDRLEVYRRSVDTFVNDAPDILAGNPLAGAATEELLKLTVRLLEDAQGKAEVGGLNERGRVGVLTRRGLLAQAEGKLDEAEQLYIEARKLAETLDHPGLPERDKAAGNLALVFNREADVAHARGVRFLGTDLEIARQQLTEAIRLNKEAIRVQQRVLDKPETGEIPPHEVRTWLGSSHYALALNYRQFARAGTTPEAVREALTAARDHARQSEEHYAAGIAAGGLAPRVRDQAAYIACLAALEFARASEKLDDLDGATAGFARAVAGLTKLMTDNPRNLKYRTALSVAGAESGDFHLMRRNGPAEAKKLYTLGVGHLLPIAKPPELDLPGRTLALNYYKLATAATREGDTKNATRWYGICLELREAQMRDAERAAGAKKDTVTLAGPKINLMLALARCGKWKESAALADELYAAFRGNPDRLFYIACGYALTSAAAEGSTDKAKYLDLAFTSLTEAVDTGYSKQAEIERDPDLDPMRADPRFPRLVERVTLGGKK